MLVAPAAPAAALAPLPQLPPSSAARPGSSGGSHGLTPPLHFKVLLLGGRSAGKTAILHRYTAGTYSPDTAPSSGVQLGMKMLHVPPYVMSMELWDVPFLPPPGTPAAAGAVPAAAGGAAIAALHQQSPLDALLLPTYLHGAHGAAIVTDTTDLRSFQHIKRWTAIIQQHAAAAAAASNSADSAHAASQPLPQPAAAAAAAAAPSAGAFPFPIILLANKLDAPRCSLSDTDVSDSAANFHLTAGFRVSAATDTQIDAAFTLLLHAMLAQQGLVPPLPPPLHAATTASGSAAAAANKRAGAAIVIANALPRSSALAGGVDIAGGSAVGGGGNGGGPKLLFSTGSAAVGGSGGGNAGSSISGGGGVSILKVSPASLLASPQTGPRMRTEKALHIVIAHSAADDEHALVAQGRERFADRDVHTWIESGNE